MFLVLVYTTKRPLIGMETSTIALPTSQLRKTERSTKITQVVINMCSS